MRRSSESTGIAKRSDDRGLVDRGGVLQLPEQRQTGDAGEDSIPVEFLIAFVRHLIRNNPSGDCLVLAIYAAAGEFDITPEQAKRFIKAVMHEKENSPWPKGFF